MPCSILHSIFNKAYHDDDATLYILYQYDNILLVHTLAQSKTCHEKRKIRPTLNIRNKSDPKARIDGEIWAYGNGIKLMCEGKFLFWDFERLYALNLLKQYLV